MSHRLIFGRKEGAERFVIFSFTLVNVCPVSYTASDWTVESQDARGAMSKGTLEKRRLIKDPVWGNLDIFPWEGKLLNHFLFNRLHNIVQNSSAYKVYPGLRYSRFLHSVGVSHVVSQLFLNAAAKADGEAREALSLEAKKIGKVVGTKTSSRIQQVLIRSFPCAPGDAVMLAAIRVAALAHDIGHLPYSHVFENAIDGFRHGVFGDAIELTVKGKAQRTKLNQLLAQHSEANNPDVKLHELLGHMFVEVLRDTFHGNAEISGLLEATSLILKEGGLPIAKAFIVGTIDADRIDFVRRDGYFSGLFNSSVDFGRIFAFYELAQDSVANRWLPRPSPRTVSETEKLLLERFLDYKYIVVHHKVHLYDEIMENVLVRLMARGSLGNFIATLCSLIELSSRRHSHLHDQGKLIDLLRKLLTEFDDPWVETEIRRQYAALDKDPNENTRLLLEAYVEDRHCFRSAFKTDSDFQTTCEKYAPKLLTQDPTSIRNAFGAAKYVLQDDLSEVLNRTVLIGSTDKKLNYGIRGDSTAKFFGVTDLYGYLMQKKVHSLTFNFWYAHDGDHEVEHESIVAKALERLQSVILEP
jgi:HD superfamily phosphohydrolase